MERTIMQTKNDGGAIKPQESSLIQLVEQIEVANNRDIGCAADALNELIDDFKTTNRASGVVCLLECIRHKLQDAKDQIEIACRELAQEAGKTAVAADDEHAESAMRH
jgi:hypothetical protein